MRKSSHIPISKTLRNLKHTFFFPGDALQEKNFSAFCAKNSACHREGAQYMYLQRKPITQFKATRIVCLHVRGGCVAHESCAFSVPSVKASYLKWEAHYIHPHATVSSHFWTKESGHTHAYQQKQTWQERVNLEGVARTLSLSRVRLYDPMDCSPPGSSVHGIFQAGVLELGCHCLLPVDSIIH